MKKLFITLFFWSLIFLSVSVFWDHVWVVDMFWRDGCGHCKDEKAFLEKLENDWIVSFNYRNVADDDSMNLFLKVVEKEQVAKVVPLTVINWIVFQWYDTNEISWNKILDILKRTHDSWVSLNDYLESEHWYWDVESFSTCSTEDNKWSTCWIWNETFSLPFVGQIDTKDFWLNLSSITLWFIDGFNPCAMWVLVMFLTVLIEFWDKRKMFQVAGIFILAESIMYYFILNVWMNAWDFIWLDNIVTPLVWALAVAAWVYFLYDWHTNDGTCKVGSLEHKRKTSKKISDLVSKPMTVAVFFWILFLAFSVNIIEFACSVWIPQTFTKLLDINEIWFLQKQWYMFLYIIFYMVDDLIVFAIAIYSFNKLWVTTKYARLSHLIWWILMLVLGLILLIEPELLIL